MKNAKTEFARRLKQAMEEAGYEPKPSVLEREFNLNYFGKKPVTLHGVMRWLKGEVIPGDDKIEVLATLLKVAPEELKSGMRGVPQIKDERGAWDKGNQQERETFEAFLSLPASHKKIVRDVILAFAKK